MIFAGPVTYDDGVTPTYYEVVMILGHSNIYHVGPFDTSDVIEAILSKHNPSIIALLGCCGGGIHYGPLMKISQMGSKAIFGFYQRRIYPDELVETSLVLGIRNYFHIQNYFREQNRLDPSNPCPEKRIIIQRSFACASLDIIPKDDPSIFANDSDEPGTSQNFFKVFRKFTTNGNPIPLACLQLALFHVFTVEKCNNGHPTINTFIDKIKQLDVSKVEEECRSELKKRQLDQIISQTTEILLLPVLQDTLDKLKDGHGRWRDVDPLQFMIATLHGYWGKNSYSTMRKCAQFHYNKLKPADLDAMGTMSEDDVHRYHLGSIVLCLFCENTYVSFDVQNEKLAFCVGLSDPKLAHKIESLDDKHYQNLPFDGVEPITITISFSSENVTSIPEQSRELVWESEHYKHMREPSDRFIKLLNENVPVSISNEKISNAFTYTTKNFKDALDILQISLLPLLQAQGTEYDINETEDPYYVKKFDNKCSQSEGRMKCFKPWPPDTAIQYKYAEMRIIDNKPPEISRCRFVYQYHHNTKKKCCAGILYFTNSHYGWDLIKEDDMDKILKEKYKIDIRGLSYFKKQEKLTNKRDLYQLQDKIKGTFPFDPIGILKIWENKYTLERT